MSTKGYKTLIERHALLTNEVHMAYMLYGERSRQYRLAKFKSELSLQHTGIILEMTFGISHVLAPTVMIPALNFLHTAELVYEEVATVSSASLASYLHYNLVQARNGKHQTAHRLSPDHKHAEKAIQNRIDASNAKKRRQHSNTALDALAFATGISHFITQHFCSTHAAAVASTTLGPAVGFLMAGRQFYKAKQDFDAAKVAQRNTHPSQLWLNHYDKLLTAKAQLNYATDKGKDKEATQWRIKVRQHQAQLDALHHVLYSEYRKYEDSDTPQLAPHFTIEQSHRFRELYRSYQPACKAFKPTLHKRIVDNLINKHKSKVKRLRITGSLKSVIGLGFCFLAASAIPGVGHVVAVIGLSIVATAGVIQGINALRQWNSNVMTSHEKHLLKHYSPHVALNYTPSDNLESLLGCLTQKDPRTGQSMPFIIGDTKERHSLALAYRYHRQLDAEPIALQTPEQCRNEKKSFREFYQTIQDMPKDQRRRFYDSILQRYREDRFLVNNALNRPFDIENQDHHSYLQSLSDSQRVKMLKKAIAAETKQRTQLALAQKAKQAPVSKSNAKPYTFVKPGSSAWLAVPQC